MKKITLLLLVLIATTSCLLREDRHDLRTAYGAVILYEGTTTAIMYNEFILMAVEMDIIAEAPLESKDRFADQFFPLHKFRVDGDDYTLWRDNVIYFKIITDGQSLATPGAIWTVTAYGNIHQQQPPITITCQTPLCWSLETTRTQQNESLKFQSTLTSTRTQIDDSPRNTFCETTFDNTPIIDHWRNVTHTLATSSPLVVKHITQRYSLDYVPHDYTLPNYSRYVIAGGAITDNFINPINGKAELVEGEFLSFSPEPYSHEETLIKYAGFKDYWSWHCIPDYHIYNYFK